MEWAIFFTKPFINYLQFPFELASKKGREKFMWSESGVCVQKGLCVCVCLSDKFSCFSSIFVLAVAVVVEKFHFLWWIRKSNGVYPYSSFQMLNNSLHRREDE